MSVYSHILEDVAGGFTAGLIENISEPDCKQVKAAAASLSTCGNGMSGGASRACKGRVANQ